MEGWLSNVNSEAPPTHGSCGDEDDSHNGDVEVVAGDGL